MDLLKGQNSDKIVETYINSLKFSLLRIMRGSDSYTLLKSLSRNLRVKSVLK